MYLTTEQLRAIFPLCVDPADWLNPLGSATSGWPAPITAAFLSQIGVESAQLNHLEENLNYSAERLMRVWPKRFPQLEAAEPYAHNPERLGNRIYANRLGNGSEESGDGYHYRGRGLIQITGRTNYRRIGYGMGEDLVQFPESISIDKELAALSARSFFVINQLDRHPLEDDDDFADLTRQVNGGLTGLDQRIAFWVSAKHVLGLA